MMQAVTTTSQPSASDPRQEPRTDEEEWLEYMRNRGHEVTHEDLYDDSIDDDLARLGAERA